MNAADRERLKTRAARLTVRAFSRAFARARFQNPDAYAEAFALLAAAAGSLLPFAESTDQAAILEEFIKTARAALVGMGLTSRVACAVTKAKAQ